MVRQILVVDGDRNFAGSLTLLLEGAGIAVRQAHDLASGLASIHEATPDVVLVDTVLPDHHSGFELCQRVRAEPALHGLRVLFTSSHVRATEMAKADAVGADGYLAKPFSPADLMQRLEAFS